jgi:pimeloyl-ACP methyl ester carboxylesterase
MRLLYWILGIVVVFASAYLLGPKPPKPLYSNSFPSVPGTSKALEEYVKGKESKLRIKPENEARIVWADDSAKAKTPFSVVYLHGFTASQEEGDPIHMNFADSFGCNLYLSRLAEHGLVTEEPLRDLTADKYWESAKEALAIGTRLGQKVILMGTSTGGTNALQLAAAYPDKVHGLILLSPNIEIFDPNAPLLNNPWGLQAARLIKKSDYVMSSDQSETYRKYWYSKYRLEGVVALQEMIETTMNKETFSKVKAPVLLMYYYKDAIRQDSVVKVSAMSRMFSQLGTPAAAKREVAVPNAGDHVIGSYIKSGDLSSVQREAFRFGSEVLGMKPRGR